MLRQFGRYISIQLVAYGLDMGSFLLVINFFGDHPVWANVVSKMIAGTFAFFAHRQLTFTGHGRSAHVEMVKYVVLLLANVPMTSAVLIVLLRWMDDVALAKFIADVSCVGITFLLAKFFVFTRADAGITR